jgi:hypothetical protein
MTSKKPNKTGDQQQSAGQIKRLKLKKQTVRDVSAEESSQVKGGCRGQSHGPTYTCKTG